MKPTPNCRRAFTLVELLVCIVIIAVLASFALSMVKRGKQSAISAATLNNLREIGAAAAGWMGDNNSFFPPNWNKNKNETYAQLLDPYMHGVKEFRSTEGKFIGPNKRLPIKVTTGFHPVTYTMNQAISPDVSDGNIPLVPVSKVHNLGEVIMMADGCQNPGNNNQSSASAHRLYQSTGSKGYEARSGAFVQVGPNEDTTASDGWFRYQNDKTHALMCDGSARTFNKGTIRLRNIWYEFAQ